MDMFTLLFVLVGIIAQNTPRPAITWKCHICFKERPDEKISVLTKPLFVKGQQFGEQNIRYCNDNELCKKLAEKHNHVQD
jgi:hypothetical protein